MDHGQTVDHSQKIERYVAEMKARGVSENTAAPPAFRKWWAAGKEIPPPHLLPFWRFVRLSGFYWGWRMLLIFLVPTVALGLLFLSPTRTLALVAVNLVAWAIGGFVFGLLLALAYRRQAQRHGVPTWADDSPAGSS